MTTPMPAPHELTSVAVPLVSTLKSLASSFAVPLAQSSPNLDRHVVELAVSSSVLEPEGTERAAALAYAKTLRTPPSADAAEYMRQRLASNPPRRRRARSDA
ncbi:hypothetical protein GCM10010250_59300 [Streptomyces althioticus]|nr:hypothetical protein GCM10010250_59300 [Streptomyces althioticus]